MAAPAGMPPSAFISPAAVRPCCSRVSLPYGLLSCASSAAPLAQGSSGGCAHCCNECFGLPCNAGAGGCRPRGRARGRAAHPVQRSGRGPARPCGRASECCWAEAGTCHAGGWGRPAAQASAAGRASRLQRGGRRSGMQWCPCVCTSAGFQFLAVQACLMHCALAAVHGGTAELETVTHARPCTVSVHDRGVCCRKRRLLGWGDGGSPGRLCLGCGPWCVGPHGCCAQLLQRRAPQVRQPAPGPHTNAAALSREMTVSWLSQMQGALGCNGMSNHLRVCGLLPQHGRRAQDSPAAALAAAAAAGCAAWRPRRGQFLRARWGAPPVPAPANSGREACTPRPAGALSTAGSCCKMTWMVSRAQPQLAALQSCCAAACRRACRPRCSLPRTTWRAAAASSSTAPTVRPEASASPCYPHVFGWVLLLTRAAHAGSTSNPRPACDCAYQPECNLVVGSVLRGRSKGKPLSVAGFDISVCVMVALLLACYSPGAPGGQPTFRGAFIPAPSRAVEGPCDSGNAQQPALPADPRPSSADAAETGRPSSATETCSCHSQGSSCREGSSCCAASCEECACKKGLEKATAACERCRGRQSPCESHVSKADVQQRLAYVSDCYPAARPTRGSLKQVFNFFQDQHMQRALPES